MLFPRRCRLRTSANVVCMCVCLRIGQVHGLYMKESNPYSGIVHTASYLEHLPRERKEEG